jgi:polysaccharide biosynthesis protein PslG
MGNTFRLLRFLRLRSVIVGWLSCIAVILAACGGGGAEATPTPTKTPAATSATAAAGATPAAPQTGAPPQAPEISTRTIAVIDASVLNVRRLPDGVSDILTTVAAGQQFAIIGRSQDGAWLQLADNGREVGWVASEYVRQETIQVGPTTGAQPAPAVASPGTTYLPPTMRSPDFGAQAFLWWRAEIADRDLTLMNEANFDWVKQSFAWETIERAGKGIYDWTIADRVVQQVNGHNIKLLARLGVDPDLSDFWAGHPPQNGDDFADFVFALASRYNCTPQAIGCIQAYQVWNEPNLAREWGNSRPDPAQYVQFLQKAYAAIKRGNPNAIVVSAGMAPTGDNSHLAMPDDLFYEGMYRAMGGSSNGYFDMLGVHGAGFAAPPETSPEEAASNQRYGGYRFFAFRHVEDIRAIMERYGDGGKKVVLLEFGWTFDPVNAAYKWHGADAGITDMVQAEYLKRSYEYAAANWQPWIGLMSLLTMPNLDWLQDGDPRDEEQYWWAILEPSQIDELRLRPAFVVLCIYFNEVKGQSCKYNPNP